MVFFYCLQKNFLNFQRELYSNSYPWLLFYSQPHSITVNWFDLSTALLPHTAVPIYKIHMFIISSLPFLGILQTSLMTLGPVARSLVSANHWLRGIKMYRFPWYLTLVSTNHASSNPGLAPSWLATCSSIG